MVLVGNDVYVTKGIVSLSLAHIEVLMNLYQPLLSKQAVCLYFTLVSKSLQTQKYELHLTLCEKTQLRIEELELARRELEEFLLVRTMVAKKEKANMYYYMIQLPKTFEQFLKHDLFSRLLLTKLGSEYIKKQIDGQSSLEDMDEFEDITSLMKFDFSSWSYDNEEQLSLIRGEVPTNELLDPYIRYDFLSYCMEEDPKSFVIPYKELLPKDISFINYCGQTYQISHEVMLKLVMKQYSRTDKTLYHEGLTLSCENIVRREQGLPMQRSIVKIEEKQQETITTKQQNGEVNYSLPPLEFVSSLSTTMKLAVSEIESFNRLQLEYKFPNDVFNVLLEYVWKKTENFNYKFMDKISADWSRSGITSLEKALQTLNEPMGGLKEKKRYVRTPRLVEEVPVYRESSDQEVEIDIDYDELNTMLKTLEKKKQTFLGKR